jgi:hypothetical protein
MVRIRAFQAINDLESCQKFVEGHMKVLKIFGITMITSANIEWFMDPSTYVLIAESTETNKVMGGARIQIAGGKNPLPIETAISDFDKNIHKIIKKYEAEGTAELCGLWNSREVAGLGIGSVFLTRTGVSIANQLNVKSIFALCAPYTIDLAKKSGFEIATFLGNQGTFYYPKDDLLATAMILNNTVTLDTCDPQERIEILKLRENPIQKKNESGHRGKFEIEFDLKIPV